LGVAGVGGLARGPLTIPRCDMRDMLVALSCV
jgi:hypothetical protein